MKNHILQKIVKIILISKIAFLILFTLFYVLGIKFSEKPIIAADSEKNELQDKNKDENFDKTVNIARQSSSKKRQGFLEGLLDLPPLNINTTKKDEIGRYLSLVERAKLQVEDRLKVLNKRAKQLQKLEKKIEKNLISLDEERQYFTKTLQQEKKIQKERLENLVDFYVKMEPKKAAPVMENLDKDLVVSLFKKMKKKQVTQILESMAPDKSVEISEYYARIGSAKEYNLLKEMNQSLRLAFNDCKGLPKESE